MAAAREAFGAVPRHAFIPDVVWHQERRELVPFHRGDDPGRWLRLAYAPYQFVITQVDDGHPVGPGLIGDRISSSASQSDVVALMVAALEVEAAQQPAWWVALRNHGEPQAPRLSATAASVAADYRELAYEVEVIRDWFDRPLWEMQPTDADVYFGKVLREARPATRTGRAAALAVFFEFLELRHKVELHNLTGRVVECPLDEMNRPRASVDPQLRVPPTEAEIEQLFAGWRGEHSWVPPEGLIMF